MIRFARLCLCATALALAPAAAHAQAAPRDVDEGRARIARQDWTGAIEALRRAVRSEPASSDAWLQLGLAHHGAGNLDSAENAIERAVRAGASGVQPHFRLARIAAARGQRDAALTHLEHAVQSGMRIPQFLTQTAEFAPLKNEQRFTRLLDEVTARRYPCRTDTLAHQFDFWLGSWDVYVSGQLAGTNEITSDLEQCVVIERWTASIGQRGTSLNFVDSNTRRWRQLWVGDGGGVVDYSGGFREGAMRFEAVTIAPNGARTLQKLTFFPIARDTVRQLFESSSDEGKTWTSGFDGLYVRKR